MGDFPGPPPLRQRLRSWIGLRTRLHRLRFPLPGSVSELHAQYARHPEAKHIVSLTDAAVIYNLVRRYRPSHCIDFGCGLGTVAAIVADAMESNGLGKVTSLEQLDWMANLAEELLPGRLRARVNIIRCDPEVRTYFGHEWSCYRFAPQAADIDMVVVDGPAEWEDEGGEIVREPNGDLVGLLPYLRPRCRVFVDGRLPSLEAYRRHLAPHFRIQQSHRWSYTVMELIRPPPMNLKEDGSITNSPTTTAGTSGSDDGNAVG